MASTKSLELKKFSKPLLRRYRIQVKITVLQAAVGLERSSVFRAAWHARLKPLIDLRVGLSMRDVGLSRQHRQLPGARLVGPRVIQSLSEREASTGQKNPSTLLLRKQQRPLEWRNRLLRQMQLAVLFSNSSQFISQAGMLRPERFFSDCQRPAIVLQCLVVFTFEAEHHTHILEAPRHLVMEGTQRLLEYG